MCKCAISGGHNLPLPLLVGIELFNLSNSDGTIASPAPGSYALYSTEMLYEGPKNQRDGWAVVKVGIICPPLPDGPVLVPKTYTKITFLFS